MFSVLLYLSGADHGRIYNDCNYSGNRGTQKNLHVQDENRSPEVKEGCQFSRNEYRKTGNPNSQPGNHYH